jgi:hypothetical protein
MRVVHEGIAVVELGALAYVWVCAVTRRRDKLLRTCVTILAAEGAGLALGRGKCPLGPVQRRLGDQVPLFVMWFGPRAAGRAVPVLVGLSVAGFVALPLRPPRPQPAPPR